MHKVPAGTNVLTLSNKIAVLGTDSTLSRTCDQKVFVQLIDVIQYQHNKLYISSDQFVYNFPFLWELPMKPQTFA